MKKENSKKAKKVKEKVQPYNVKTKIIDDIEITQEEQAIIEFDKGAEDRGITYNEKGTVKLNCMTYALFVIEDMIIVCTARKVFFKYEVGVYRRMPVIELHKILMEDLNTFDTNIWSKSAENSYTDIIERKCFAEHRFNERPNVINLSNGLLGINKKQFKGHTPKFYSTIQLPVTYDENAICPNFKKFLDEICCGDKELIALIQEIMGYCLTTYTEAQKFFVFYGIGANGKSVLCTIIKHLVGVRNYSTLSIKDLGKRFSTSSLLDKVLNISTENESTSKGYDSQNIKAITGGDELSAEFKGQDVFTFKPFCKLIFSVNTLPKFNDTSKGLLRRICIVPFNAKFSIDDGTADVDLEKKLLDELSGIFNFALEGLVRLKANKFKFTTSTAVDNAYNEFVKNIDPYVVFLEEVVEFIEPDKNKKISTKVIYNRFILWATTNNYTTHYNITPQKFWADLKVVLNRENMPELNILKTGGNNYILGMRLK